MPGGRLTTERQLRNNEANGRLRERGKHGGDVKEGDTRGNQGFTRGLR